MKIMKNHQKRSFFSVIIGLFLAVVITYTNKYGFSHTSCGLQGSKLLESEGLKLTKSAIKSRQYITFSGPSGMNYELEATLYAYKQGFINCINLSGQSNIILTPKEVYNAYNHVFMNVYFDKLNDYIRDEMAESLKLSSNKEDKVREAIKYFTLNWIFTKQKLGQLVLSSGEVIPYNNKFFSKHLLMGEELEQYIGGLVHILNTREFLKVMKEYGDANYIDRIIGTQEVIKPFGNFKITPVWLNYIENVLGDLVNMFTMDTKTPGEFILKEKYIINELCIERDAGSKTNKINLKKFVLDNNTPVEKEVYDFFDIKTSVLENFDFSQLPIVGENINIGLKSEYISKLPK